MRHISIWLTIALGVFTAFTALAQPLVSTDWLHDSLDKESVVLIDLRNKIDGGSYETWLEGHIPGSVHSDYLQAGWRVGRDDVVGLLPDASDFQALARKLGVSQDSHVILIPAGVSATDFGSAARAYWTFKVFGHETVSILDGGYQKWTSDYADKIATGSGLAPLPGNFTAMFDAASYISTDGVKDVVGDGKTLLLDGRTAEQYAGKAKHGKALKAGHIPGAVLHPQSVAYDEATNQVKSIAALETLYADHADGPIVSYCNTGHWAATNWFVLSELLGRDDVKLYDGSMVEWTADSSNIVGIESNLDKVKGFLKGILGS